MIAIANEVCTQRAPAWHKGFLAMLPAIHSRATFALRSVPPEARADALAEVLAHAVIAYERLYRQGRQALAYAAPLVRFGMAQYRVGRRVGHRGKRRDLLSMYARRKQGVVVERLDRFDDRKRAWQEILIEDRSTTPAELACARLDFAEWLETLSPRDRQLAETLAAGESTKHAARLFHVTPARISQLRHQLQRAWQSFQGTQPQCVECAT